MLSPADSAGEAACPSVHSFACSYGQILLPQHLMNGLSNLDKNCRELSVFIR